VNQSDKFGTTPLMRLGQTDGDQSLIRLLIAAGANVNARDDYGKTVLDNARARHAGATCIQLLIDAGAKDSAAQPTVAK
jgi:ankyrin repeat protein